MKCLVLGVSVLTAMLAAPAGGADPKPRCSPWELPDQGGFCEVGSQLIGDLEGSSFGLTQHHDGKQYKLVLQARPSESQGEAEWKDLDELYLTVAENRHVLDLSGSCRWQGNVDPEIVAVVSARDSTKAVKAWRADRKRGKIVPVAARRVDCESHDGDNC